MKSKYILYLFLFTILLPKLSLAKYQPNFFPAKVGIDANVQMGRIFRHTTNFQPTINGPSYALELNAFKQTDGSKAWQRKLHYPEIGGGVFAVFHHNSDTMGNAYAAFVYWKYPIVRSKIVDFNIKMGIGAAYATKKYDEKENSYNNVLGSKLNAFVELRFGLEWKIASQVKLITAFTYSHYSDGAVKLPNLGINTPTGTLGIIYYPKKEPIAINRDSIPSPQYKNEFLAQTTFGMLDVTKFTPDKSWLMQATTFGYSRYINITNKISAGTTLEFNFGWPHLYVNQDKVVDKIIKKASTEWSVYVGDEILIGKFGFYYQLGAYLYHTYRMPAPLYFRLGAHVYVGALGKKQKGSLFFPAGLKAHGGTAQLVEGGVGGLIKF
ncbi:MAG: acyloxyacyl hydrolase [Chitinophagales bacterium]|nr:acyloxyacyl hydrolase [Chitinophagales bacterium]